MVRNSSKPARVSASRRPISASSVRLLSGVSLSSVSLRTHCTISRRAPFRVFSTSPAVRTLNSRPAGENFAASFTDSKKPSTWSRMRAVLVTPSGLCASANKPFWVRGL